MNAGENNMQNPSPPLRYKDTWQEFSGIRDMTLARVANPAPNLGGSRCPAYDHTFGLSEDDGTTWRNPTPNDRSELALAIIDTNRCCQRDVLTCAVRNRPPE